jgi:hypothetical protein
MLDEQVAVFAPKVGVEAACRAPFSVKWFSISVQ